MRRSVRYRLSVPIVVLWENERGIIQREQAITRDLSTEGVFVFSTLALARGTHVTLEVQLPSFGDPARGPRLVGHGQVVRVDREGENRGFAIRTDSGLSFPSANENA